MHLKRASKTNANGIAKTKTEKKKYGREKINQIGFEKKTKKKKLH